MSQQSSQRKDKMSWQSDIMAEQEIAEQFNYSGEAYLRDLYEDVKDK